MSKNGKSTKSRSYEVGYGKPPKRTQFKKGQSGNPLGRPRKPKPRPTVFSDAITSDIFEREIYRPVKIMEDGKTTEIPAIQAVIRKMVVTAGNGNRLAQKDLFRLTKEFEDNAFQKKIERYVDMKREKEAGEKRLAAAEETGAEPPHLLPHPDDIVLNSKTGDAYVNGPRTPEDEHLYRETVALRDFAMLRSVHTDKERQRKKIELADGEYCPFLVCAGFLNAILPERMQWTEEDEISALMRFGQMNNPERETFLEKEWERLQRDQPPPPSLSPEAQVIFDRTRRRLVAKKN